VQLIGIDQGTVNVEDESEHGDKEELRTSIEPVHVLELIRLSIMKCADRAGLFLFEFSIVSAHCACVARSPHAKRC
jgi:cadmium resistance protein CadD (predicted permease)